LDSTTVTVTPTDDDIITNEIRTICFGDTTMIHGNAVTMEGVYPDTIALPFGCDSISTVTLQLLGTAPVPIDSTVVICEGDTFSFFGQTFSSPATAEHIIQSSVNGCDSIIISLNLSVASFEVEIQGEHAAAPGDSISLSVQSAFDSIVWNGGSGDCGNAPDCQNLVTMDTVFMVTVFDENGCMASDTHAVFAIIQCFPDKVVVPNVFTPNNDNVNDTFSIVSKGEEAVTGMRIWDRWGKLVYEGTAPWDGMYDGKPAASDVYIYDIIVGCAGNADKEEVVLRGDVTLLR
jgi:gliding motility-associated-like protein